MKNLLRIVTLMAVVLSVGLTTGCKEDEIYSHRYPCRCHFYYQMHPTSLLFAAYRSPGSYVYANQEMKQDPERGIMFRYICVQSNDGKTPVERNRIETQVETNVPYVLGANNEIGLIIGCTNFNGPVAYDRICRNCNGYFPLTWTATNRQRVECKNCKRMYDLETAAIVEGKSGDGLLRYKISFDEVRLNVSN